MGNIGTDGFIGTSGVIGTYGTSGVIGTIEWRRVFHISHVPLHIEIYDTTGFISAISIIDTNGVNDANE